MLEGTVPIHVGWDVLLSLCFSRILSNPSVKVFTETPRDLRQRWDCGNETGRVVSVRGESDLRVPTCSSAGGSAESCCDLRLRPCNVPGLQDFSEETCSPIGSEASGMLCGVIASVELASVGNSAENKPDSRRRLRLEIIS